MNEEKDGVISGTLVLGKMKCNGNSPCSNYRFTGIGGGGGSPAGVQEI